MLALSTNLVSPLHVKTQLRCWSCPPRFLILADAMAPVCQCLDYALFDGVVVVRPDLWFLQFQPKLLTSNIINCQRFDYSAVVFFRPHLHTTLGILLKYNIQVS